MSTVKTIEPQVGHSTEAVEFLKELSTNWQPISTAPTSGTVRLWWRNAGETTGSFAIDEDWKPVSKSPREGWKGDDDQGIPHNQEDCTRWMLQSEPPPGHKFPAFVGRASEQDSLRTALVFKRLSEHVCSKSIAK